MSGLDSHFGTGQEKLFQTLMFETFDHGKSVTYNVTSYKRGDIFPNYGDKSRTTLAQLPFGRILDGGADEVAPFCPGTVIVADVRIPQQIAQNKPGMGAALANAAVGDYVLVRR
jgi:hypothetical protein